MNNTSFKIKHVFHNSKDLYKVKTFGKKRQRFLSPISVLWLACRGMDVINIYLRMRLKEEQSMRFVASMRYACNEQ